MLIEIHIFREIVGEHLCVLPSAVEHIGSTLQKPFLTNNLMILLDIGDDFDNLRFDIIWHARVEWTT